MVSRFSLHTFFPYQICAITSQSLNMPYIIYICHSQHKADLFTVCTLHYAAVKQTPVSVNLAKGTFLKIG